MQSPLRLARGKLLQRHKQQAAHLRPRDVEGVCWLLEEGCVEALLPGWQRGALSRRHLLRGPALCAARCSLQASSTQGARCRAPVHLCGALWPCRWPALRLPVPGRGLCGPLGRQASLLLLLLLLLLHLWPLPGLKALLLVLLLRPSLQVLLLVHWLLLVLLLSGRLVHSVRHSSLHTLLSIRPASSACFVPFLFSACSLCLHVGRAGCL